MFTLLFLLFLLVVMLFAVVTDCFSQARVLLTAGFERRTFLARDWSGS